MPNVSEKHITFIYRAEDDSIASETKVVENPSSQFRVATVTQQSFHVGM
jgi:hypothetical protein